MPTLLRQGTALVLLLSILGCSPIRFHIYGPDDPPTVGLLRRLKISQTDFTDVQQVLKTHEQTRGYRAILWQRAIDGMVEVWLLRDGAERFDHGPVRFFYRHEGRWHLLMEMSGWSGRDLLPRRR